MKNAPPVLRWFFAWLLAIAVCSFAHANAQINNGIKSTSTGPASLENANVLATHNADITALAAPLDVIVTIANDAPDTITVGATTVYNNVNVSSTSSGAICSGHDPTALLGRNTYITSTNISGTLSSFLTSANGTTTGNIGRTTTGGTANNFVQAASFGRCSLGLLAQTAGAVDSPLNTTRLASTKEGSLRDIA
jgi:hypothetical protein